MGLYYGPIIMFLNIYIIFFMFQKDSFAAFI